MPECVVLPGIAGLTVQGLLFACCVGVFYVKRQREQNKLGADARTKEEFFLDASKQFAGAGWIHIMNLGFASILNSLMSGGDECEWYWINILVDTTLGTAVAYFLLKVAMTFIKKKLSQEAADDFKPGEYRGEDGVIDMQKYVKQLVVWLVVVSSMKIMMVIVMFLFSGPLLAFAGFILAPFLTQAWLKLLIVMIAFPLLMDAFQIWMVDNFIKKRPQHAPEGELLQDAEVGTVYVEAAADALMACSHRCEEAFTEETLLVVKAKIDEAVQGVTEHVQNYQEPPLKKAEGWSPVEKVDSDRDGNFSTHPHTGSGHFETQYKFQTIIPPDQVEA